LYKLIQNDTGKYYQHLESIQPEIQKIEDPNTKRVVSVLLNLIEVLASDNARLKKISFINAPGSTGFCGSASG
jgi:hypothetical protein